MSNSRFAVATHILTGVALNQGDGPVSSEYLASSVNTNPVVVRRIVQDLVKAGLLEGKAGKGGGSRLAIKPEKIDLHQVYKAVQKTSIFEYNPNAPNKKCPLSCKMKGVLTPIFNSVDKSLEDRLRGIRLSDLLAQLS